MLFWLFLELGTLSLIPCFFVSLGYTSLTSLFSYLVVSSISSFFIVSGFLWEDLFGFIVLGLCIKFGLFPFFGWVYSVVVGSNWVVVWGFSTFLKSSFLFFPYFLSSGGSLGVFLAAAVSFIVLSLLFWVYSYSWKHCWCHMMLSSSVAVVCMALVLPTETLLLLFFVYICWCSCVIVFFSGGGLDYLSGFNGLSQYFFVGLLVAYPFSISIFYKLLLSFCMYACGFLVFCCWVVYNIAEQFYLIKFFIGLGMPRGSFGGWSLV